jgi:hypothetical protein
MEKNEEILFVFLQIKVFLCKKEQGEHNRDAISLSSFPLKAIGLTSAPDI